MRKTGIAVCSTNTIVEDGPVVLAYACQFGAEGNVVAEAATDPLEFKQRPRKARAGLPHPVPKA